MICLSILTCALHVMLLIKKYKFDKVYSENYLFSCYFYCHTTSEWRIIYLKISQRKNNLTAKQLKRLFQKTHSKNTLNKSDRLQSINNITMLDQCCRRHTKGRDCVVISWFVMPQAKRFHSCHLLITGIAGY